MLKKVAVFIIATIGASVAMAGNIELAPPVEYQGVYLEGNIGYASIDWYDFAMSPPNFTANGADHRNADGGFTYGLVAGYQVSEYWAVEVGWYNFPTVAGTLNVRMEETDATTYAAVKAMAPLYINLYLFGKLGAQFRYGRLKANTQFTFNGTGLPINTRYWQVLLATGVQYYFTPNWSINGQYMYVPAYERMIPVGNSTRLNVPTGNVITIGVGYKFIV